MSTPSLFISAGDPSGDNASAHLVNALKERIPRVETFGLGGPKLRALGQRQLADPEHLAVLGFWEVARHFLFFKQLLRDCAEQIAKTRPEAVILVDYPGFNLRLARMIKPLGIPIVYYISPQLWAWGKRRLADIRRYVDLMMVILPFEQDFYAETGVNSNFVGHYLLEDISDEYIASPLPERDPLTLAVLPGSRAQEIQRMLPAMVRAAKMFTATHNGRAVISGIKGRFDYERLLTRLGGERIELSYDDSRRIINRANLVLTASGTATLETAIIGRPMVIIYKTGFLTYQIAKRLVELDVIGLANLVIGEKVVPELIQNRATASKMVESLSKFVADRAYTQSVVARLNSVPQLLGGKGASARAADSIIELIGDRA